MNNNKLKDIFNKVLLFALAFSLPFYNISINDRSPIFLIFILIIVLFLTGYVNIRKRYPLELIILIFLCLYKLSSIIWSIDPIQTKEVVIYTSIPILILTIFFFNFIKNINDLNFLLKIYILACFIFAVFVLLNFFFKPQDLTLNLENARLTLFNTNPNEVSFFMSYGIITVFYLNNLKKFNKIIVSFLIFIFISVILFTGSRTGFVNLIFIMLFFLIGKRNLFLYLIFVVFVFLLFYLFKDQLSPVVILRYINLINLFSDHPDFYREGYRGWLVINGLSNFFDKSIFYQIFGIGYEGYGKLMYEKYGISASHHNQLLGYLVELGFFGLIINLILFAIIIKKILKLSQHHSSIYFLFLIPIFCFTLTAGFDAKFFFYFFIIIMIKFYDLLIIQKKNN